MDRGNMDQYHANNKRSWFRNRNGGLKPRMGFVAAMVAGVAVVSILPISPAISEATAFGYAGEPGDDAFSGDWNDWIWTQAMHQQTGVVLDRFVQFPETHDNANVRELGENISGYVGHLTTQLEDRISKYNESLVDLETHIEAGEWREAIADALTAHEIALRPDEILAHHKRASELPDASLVFQEPVVAAMITQIDTTAKSAELSGNWLTAQDLYYRLNALLLVEGTFEKDLRRVSRRVGLLRFYYPERLSELTNEHLISLGEEERPGFAFEGDSWEDNLDGINRRMVLEGLSYNARVHLWQKGWIPQIVAGCDALEVFATTTDLGDVFPMLSDDESRVRFLAYVAAQKEEWSRKAKGDRISASSFIRKLQQTNESTINVPEVVLLHEFMEGAMTSIDRFSDFIWPYEIDMFKRQLEGAYVGVGIQISLDEAFRLNVVTPLEDSPAQRVGIRAGDKIIEVDGQSTLGITLNQAVDTITGPRGTQVVLTIERLSEDEPIEYPMLRQPIKIKTIKGWKRDVGQEWDYMLDKDHGIGYIRMTQFMPETARDFDDAIASLKAQGVRGVILDLRFNPGGLLSQAVEVSNRFVEKGLIVKTVDPFDRSKDYRAMKHRAADLEGLDIVVLINEGSASASEIVAGCLRDHDRALLIGNRSYGKGSVQKVRQLPGGNALLRITCEHYLLPSGDHIHKEPGSTEWGVDPHMVVRMTPKQIADSIMYRQLCDILRDGEEAIAEVNEDGEPVEKTDPQKLLDDAMYDLQLQTAVIMLQSQTLSGVATQAMMQESGR